MKAKVREGKISSKELVLIGVQAVDGVGTGDWDWESIDFVGDLVDDESREVCEGRVQ